MKRIFFTLLMVGAVVATSISCKKDEKKDDKKSNSTSQQSSNEPKSTHFPDPGWYKWQYDYSMTQYSHNFRFYTHQDSVKYRKGGYMGYTHTLTKVSFLENENKWIGVASNSTGSFDLNKDGKYFVLIFRNVKKNSVDILLSKGFETENEAKEFVIPANPNWGRYDRE